jgi:hypothetical protein
MSGKQEKQAGPVALTQQDVDALTKGGKAALSVRRRLPGDRASKRTSVEPSTHKASPQPISRREMAAMVRRGGVPPNVRKRILAASPSPAGAEAYSSSAKATPTGTPRERKYTKE